MSLNDMSHKKRRKFEQYQDMIGRLYPSTSVNKNTHGWKGVDLTRTVTFQVTDACNLACSYCYQINKGTRRMSFETAKKFVDLLLSGEKGFKDYVDPSTSAGLIVEFIGGEPFLEIELIGQIVDYLRFQLAIKMHPWSTKFCLSICSNGVLYFDPKVQEFLKKNSDILSLSVTIDGNKELHDSCRVFPNGDPSYDLAVAAANDWKASGHYMGSKITIAPANIQYLYDAIIHMVDLEYIDINANCVYEIGWEQEHATVFYYQLKKVADYFIDNDLVDTVFLALFNDFFFRPKKETDLNNWCGGTGAMLSVDPEGRLYPCIRYMESSLGEEQEPISIGSLEDGLGCTDKCKGCITMLNNIDRRTESTDECFYCPIAEGCSWCSAYNYQVFGTPDKRATYICEMHKARSLANSYFWNRHYIKNNINNVFEIHCPDEWALKIIPKEELDNLKNLIRRN